MAFWHRDEKSEIKREYKKLFKYCRQVLGMDKEAAKEKAKEKLREMGKDTSHLD